MEGQDQVVHSPGSQVVTFSCLLRLGETEGWRNEEKGWTVGRKGGKEGTEGGRRKGEKEGRKKRILLGSHDINTRVT